MHVFGYIVLGLSVVMLLIAGAITLLLKASGGTYTKPPSASEQRRSEQAAQQEKIVCQFCQTAGGVTSRRVRRAKRKTATRVFGAIATAGASLPMTGVSKKGWVSELSCKNCGMKWDVPQAF